MKKSLMFAGLALAAAVASTFYAPTAAWARAEGTWLWNTFILTSAQTMSIAGTETHTGTESHSGAITNTGNEYNISPATQTVASGGTVAADACGGLKRITAAAYSALDTTNPIAAPVAGNTGCVMDIINVGSNGIAFPNSSTTFPTTNSATITLLANGSMRVVSDGTYWRKMTSTEY